MTVINVYGTVMQALLVPLQGFLNALAYGWTRGDFLSVMSSQHHRNSRPGTDSFVISYESTNNDEETVVEDDEEWEENTHQTRHLSTSLMLESPTHGADGGEKERKRGDDAVMTPASPVILLWQQRD